MGARNGTQRVKVGEDEVSLADMESCMDGSWKQYADEAGCLDEGAASMRRCGSSSIRGIA